ncbi:MAG TPA: response regulator [Dehalococcoidales bacterium]|nr:response regulator [Dehalococcoidales bacterium]
MALNLPILIVDDEPIVRESIRDWLKEIGYNVLTAETGEEALETLSQHEVGVVILDIRLPGRTGISVLKEIREKKPLIQTIIITAYPSSELTAEALKLGALDYLIKPIIPDDLERLVRDAVHKIEVSKGGVHER